MRAAVSFAVFLGACAVGAPPGFSQGDTWTLPLVAPEHESRLLTPVTIDGRGPYLFAIDPDLPMTIVDREILANTDFRRWDGPRRLDQHDTTHETFYRRIPNVRVGDLSVSLLLVAETPEHSFDDDGRRIYGVLGHDVIADSLVFGFARDKGIAWLQTQDVFQPPAGAREIEYNKLRDEPVADPRKLVTTAINGHELALHLSLGDTTSQLYPRAWAAAGLTPVDRSAMFTDDTGQHRAVEHLGVAAHVTADGITRDGLGFTPYDDRRFRFDRFDGTLGLDFFRPFDVTVNWHRTTIYVTPRRPVPVGQRLARWGWNHCSTADCFQAALETDGYAQPSVRVTRDPAVTGNVTVIVHATPASGPPLPSIEVSLPAGLDQLSAPIDDRYAGAQLAVFDASPFGRPCADPRGCVSLELAPPP
jgi:hypothetical protein